MGIIFAQSVVRENPRQLYLYHKSYFMISMDAVILAGGRGERLRPVTDYIPKPLVPICNIPILEWQISYLERYDIKRVILCSGYKSEMLRNFVERRKFKADLVLSDEIKPLGTGGALKNAASLISVSYTHLTLPTKRIV